MKINQFFDKSISWSVFFIPNRSRNPRELVSLLQPFVGSGNVALWYL